jgi:formylglycine-generating enzyme required for sulfatase activity
MPARALLGLAVLLWAGAARPDDNPFVEVPGGQLRTALPLAKQELVPVHSFLLQRHPVTNREFLTFLTGHPKWQRGSVPVIMAEGDYLGVWAGPLDPGPHAADSQPVTQVSWFAAQAYCDSLNARLPDWYEWELAAAAGPTQPDARSDPAWRQQILDWYARPAGKALPAVEQGAPNFYGLYDLHGLVWEWVYDFNSLLPADADPDKFCGSGALDVEQKENYAVLMRIALLGSLRAADTGHTVGFRCARDAQGTP